VVIKDERVMDSAPNKGVLFRRLEKAGVDTSSVLVEYVRPKGIITIW